jgi:hypothetical protein
MAKGLINFRRGHGKKLSNEPDFFKDNVTIIWLLSLWPFKKYGIILLKYDEPK